MITRLLRRIFRPRPRRHFHPHMPPAARFVPRNRRTGRGRRGDDLPQPSDIYTLTLTNTDR